MKTNTWSFFIFGICCVLAIAGAFTRILILWDPAGIHDTAPRFEVGDRVMWDGVTNEPINLHTEWRGP